MAKRLYANKRHRPGVGELRTPLPVGYIHDDAGNVLTDPDAGIRAAIRDVFAAFAASGSAYGAVAGSPVAGSCCEPAVGQGPGSCVGSGSTTPGCSGS
jgi:hypothetical protein